MWDLTGPEFSHGMICGTDSIHPDLELNSDTINPEYPNITWSGFAAGIYAVHSDGSGSNALNVNGFSIADGATMYADAAHTALLLADSRIPGGGGYDASGDSLATWFSGPIAASMKIITGTEFPNLTVTGALGPPTQAIDLFTGGKQVVVSTLPFNTAGQIFVCNKGMAVYPEAQSAESIAKIESAIC